MIEQCWMSRRGFLHGADHEALDRHKIRRQLDAVGQRGGATALLRLAK